MSICVICHINAAACFRKLGLDKQEGFHDANSWFRKEWWVRVCAMFNFKLHELCSVYNA